MEKQIFQYSEGPEKSIIDRISFFCETYAAQDPMNADLGLIDLAVEFNPYYARWLDFND